MSELQTLYNKLIKELDMLKLKQKIIKNNASETDAKLKEGTKNNITTKQKLEETKIKQKEYIKNKTELLGVLLCMLSTLFLILSIVISGIGAGALMTKLFSGKLIFWIIPFLAGMGITVTIEIKLVEKLGNYFQTKINNSNYNQQMLSQIKELEEKNSLELTELLSISNQILDQLSELELCQKDINAINLAISYIEKETSQETNFEVPVIESSNKGIERTRNI